MGGFSLRMNTRASNEETGAFSLDTTTIDANNVLIESYVGKKLIMQFNAQNSNSLYSASSTVQPPARQALIIIKV